MWTTDRDHIKRVIDEECNGSLYMAVNLVAKQSRKKLAQTDYMILDSQAISWALTNIPPEVIHTRPSEAYPRGCYGLTSLEDMLSYVDDESVKQSVEISYDRSVKGNHLIYFYNKDLDPSRKARVRILTRMAWDNYITNRK